jgi:hypothetical protein
VPDHPFLRAFGWAEGFSRTKDSPLYYGILLCPVCRYPGTEVEFKPQKDAALRNVQSIRRLFVEDHVGLQGPLAKLIGGCPEELPQPERAARLLLAAIRAEMLVYPGFWRLPELGRLHLRLAWLYLDELHLDWSPTPPVAPPVYADHGPGAERMREILGRLETLRGSWPDIPLDEEAARLGALRFYEEDYQRGRGEPTPEEAVGEEHRLAELLILAGRLDAAQEMFARAVATCDRHYRLERTRQVAAERNVSVTISARRDLAVRVRRLARLAEEIRQQRHDFLASLPTPPPSAPAADGGTSARPDTPPVPKPKKRFGLFG